MRIQELPYADPCSIFPAFKDQPFSIFLDSCGLARYSFMMIDPTEVIYENPFEVLRKNLKQGSSLLPFAGGWVGYLGYEFYTTLEEKLPSPLGDDIGVPKCFFGYYESALIFDHQEKRLLNVGPEAWPWGGGAKRSLGEGACPLPRLGQGGGSRRSIISNFSLTNYCRTIEKIKTYIASGDCYQVNLSQRFEAPIKEDPWALYQRLRQVNPSPYAAYMNLGNFQILSSSPECFLKIKGREVTTRPIKGTRPRGQTPQEDARLKEELMTSSKDRAELLMITDLERNDLGKICREGTVKVSELAKVESFAHVHHLVSNIEGRLADGKDAIDALIACFPGGSITGAPKIRAMEIIRELETVPRGIYTGAIGFLDNEGNTQFNIAIRTLTVKKGRAYFHAGGGIVADSNPEAEYAETLAKAQGMTRAL